MTRQSTRLAFAVVALAVVLPFSGGGPAHTTSAAGRPLLSPADSTIQGVVWHPSRAQGPALRQLRRIAATGVTAVRLVGPLPADTVFGRADTLGLALFVDLPVAYVPAPALRDSLEAARPTLQRLRRLAGQHPSIRAIGLARGANTSVPAACAPLRAWTRKIQNWSSSPSTYYVTPFTASADRCGAAVDRVLLNTRAHPDPVARRAQWRGADAAVGFGALGTWVRPGADTGLRVPHSPERQARYLETALGDVVGRASSSTPVFVYRWRDRARPTLPTRRYGLRASDGTARPAAHVLEGFYRGTQRVFAFPDGTAPSRTPLVPLLLGWGILGLLGGLYANNAFVRETLSRYFAAHGFYRDAVRKGREVGRVENLLLLGAVGAAVGIIGALAARLAADRAATGLFVEALPRALRSPLAAALTQPATAGIVFGGGSAALLLGWGLLLVGVGRLEGRFTAAQGVMLVTWPCWPAVPGMMVALVAATDPPVAPGLLGLGLFVGGLATTTAVSVRVLRDFWAVSGVERPWIAVLTLPSPLVLLGVVTTVLILEYEVPLRLLWHLLTRT
ncbi:MAG: hypothetical protein ABEL97_15825 [Salinibacter sp.]